MRSRQKRKSSTRGWKKLSPKNQRSRRSLRKRCGPKCFLMPKQFKYPICSRFSRTCKPDCRGLLSAIIRASQNKKPKLIKKARRIARKSRCKWIKSR